MMGLAIILFLGTWLRVAQMGEPLWVDELHTSWVVVDAPAKIAVRAAAGNQSPPFFFAVWASTKLIGHSEAGLRFPSLVAGVTLIFVGFACGWRWCGSWTAALLIAFLIAVNHECILFANEARPYAWLQLFSLLHAWGYWSVLRRPTGTRRTLLVLGAAWLFYLHYTAVLFLAAEAVGYWFLRLRCPEQVTYRPIQWMIDSSCLLLLLLPSIPQLSAIAQRRENWERIVRLAPSVGVRNAFWLYLVTPLAGLAIGRWWRPPLQATATGASTWIWVTCCMAVPPLLAWTATLTGVAALWMLRYFIAALVPAIILAGLLLARFPTTRFRGLAAVLMMVAGVYTSGITFQWQYDGRFVGDRNENWGAAVRWLDAELPVGPVPVFLCPGLLEDLALLHVDDADLTDYCLYPLQGIYRLRGRRLVPLSTTRHLKLDGRQRQLAGAAECAGLLVRARPATVDVIQGELARAFARGEGSPIRIERRAFGFLTALLFRRD